MSSLTRTGAASLTFIGVLGGFLTIAIGGTLGAPPTVGIAGVALIMLGLLIPFLRLGTSRRARTEAVDAVPNPPSPNDPKTPVPRDLERIGR